MTYSLLCCSDWLCHLLARCGDLEGLVLISLHCRLLEEESSKRAELEKWHLEQQQAIRTTEAEKQELENQRVIKEQALQEAMEQLQQLELERKQALEQYEVIKPIPANLYMEILNANFFFFSAF